MRIDAPSGSSSWLIGFFSGSFRGELEGLSGSLQELRDYTTDTSASINTTIYDLSGSFDSTIKNISGSITGSISEISKSIDRTIHEISSSVNQRITAESTSIDTTVHDLSGSFDFTVHDISSSISGTLETVSSSIDATVHDISSSILGTISAISNSVDQRITEESASINATVYTLSGSFNQRDNLISSSLGQISASISTTVYDLSSSFDSTIYNISSSIFDTIVSVSNSLDTRITGESGSAAEDRRDIRARYTQLSEFQQYTASADATHYKSGSDAYFNTLIVSGNTLMMGDLVVSGSSTHIHTKDVYIEDKFVQIASGSLDAFAANGAGFGIDGANVSMSYDAADDTMHLNKDLTANVTGSLYGTASYAKDVADDGIIARALVELYNTIHIVTGSVVESSSIYLNCSSTRTHYSCLIQSQSRIDLVLPTTVEDGVEHFILFTNSGSVDCIIVPPLGSLVPDQTLSGHIDGGYADSLYPSSTQFICSKDRGLGLEYVVQGGTVLFTHINTYN